MTTDMKRIALYTILVCIFATTAEANQPNDTIDASNFNTKKFEKTLFEKVNAYRNQNSVKPLFQNSVIYKVAKDQTIFLSDKKQLSHEQPTTEKESVQKRLIYYLDIKQYSVGENIARSTVLKPTTNYDENGNTKRSTASTYEEAATYMFNSWKQSSVHNINMLYKTFEISAIAVYFNPSTYTITATQVFARID